MGTAHEYSTHPNEGPRSLTQVTLFASSLYVLHTRFGSIARARVFDHHTTLPSILARESLITSSAYKMSLINRYQRQPDLLPSLLLVLCGLFIISLVFSSMLLFVPIVLSDDFYLSAEDAPIKGSTRISSSSSLHVSTTVKSDELNNLADFMGISDEEILVIWTSLNEYVVLDSMLFVPAFFLCWVLFFAGAIFYTRLNYFTERFLYVDFEEVMVLAWIFFCVCVLFYAHGGEID